MSVEDVARLLTVRLESSWHRWLTQPAAPERGSAQAPASAALVQVRTAAADNLDAGLEPGEGQDDAAAAGPAAVTAWPMVVPLGRPSQQLLNSSFAEPNRWAIRWQDSVAGVDGLDLRWQDRTVNRSRQPMPTHLVLDGPDAVARFAGGGWASALVQGRERWALLTEHFPTTASPEVLRAVHAVDDTTFALLLRSAAWLRDNVTAGLTPRQVPIEGTHAKWLQSHHTVLLALSGKSDLGLVSRPTRIGFTYLDPAHRAAGRRWHDSHTLGDAARPEYLPSVAVISENKDTAVLFEELPGGISIEGGGDAAARRLPAVPWLAEVPLLVYWGDLDADGFEIVNALRAAGLPVRSILMDMATYERYEAFGSWTDKTGKPLRPSPAKPLPYLSEPERQVYEAITAPSWARVRRIEQERISLATARAGVEAELRRQASIPA